MGILSVLSLLETGLQVSDWPRFRHALRIPWRQKPLEGQTQTPPGCCKYETRRPVQRESLLMRYRRRARRGYGRRSYGRRRGSAGRRRRSSGGRRLRIGYRF